MDMNFLFEFVKFVQFVAKKGRPHTPAWALRFPMSGWWGTAWGLRRAVPFTSTSRWWSGRCTNPAELGLGENKYGATTKPLRRMW